MKRGGLKRKRYGRDLARLARKFVSKLMEEYKARKQP